LILRRTTAVSSDGQFCERSEAQCAAYLLHPCARPLASSALPPAGCRGGSGYRDGCSRWYCATAGIQPSTTAARPTDGAERLRRFCGEVVVAGTFRQSVLPQGERGRGVRTLKDGRGRTAARLLRICVVVDDCVRIISESCRLQRLL